MTTTKPRRMSAVEAYERLLDSTRRRDKDSRRLAIRELRRHGLRCLVDGAQPWEAGQGEGEDEGEEE